MNLPRLLRRVIREKPRNLWLSLCLLAQDGMSIKASEYRFLVSNRKACDDILTYYCLSISLDKEDNVTESTVDKQKGG